MPAPRKILTLSAIGLDSPGLVSRITAPIYRLNGNIIDVEENCRKGLFSIFLAIDFTSSSLPAEEIREKLKGIEKETDLKVILGECGDSKPAVPREPNHLFVTILGVDRPGIISRVSSLTHRHNANIESCRMIARGTFFSMEMAIAVDDVRTGERETLDEAVDRMKAELKDLCTELKQSVVVQNESAYRQAKKIVVFDIEVCLIPDKASRRFLDNLNEILAPLDRRIEPPAEQGLWAQAVADQAHQLKGLSVQALQSAGKALEFHDGVPELISILKSMGYKVAFLSTGLDCFLRHMYEIQALDYAFCNSMHFQEDGTAAGTLEEPVLTSATKNEILEFIMNVENIRRDQVVAVGDGSPRSRFMKDVGLSIACMPGGTAAPVDGIFSSHHMLNILYCLGLSDADLKRYRETVPSPERVE